MMRGYAKLRRATLGALFVLVATAGGVVAGPLEDGVAAFKSKDHATAQRLLRPLANQGNAEAAKLGVMAYRAAVDAPTPQGYAEAVVWLRKAADHGSGEAMFWLHMAYEFGSGVPQDNAESLKWLRKAADDGNADAQDNLGEYYAAGHHVRQDNAEAARWYRKAADQADSLAQYELGQMYVDGEGVPQDYVQAHMWFNLAASEIKIAAKFRDDLASKIPAQPKLETPAGWWQWALGFFR
jgi:TPR repeat protein